MKKFLLIVVMLIYQAFPNSVHSPFSVIDTVYDTIPIITLLGANPMSLELGYTYIEPGATATDDTDGDITDQIEITGTVNTTVIGTYTRTYTVVNSLGNTAVRNRWVYVIVDSIQPVDTIPIITLLGANPMSLELGYTYIEPGATATDDTDGDITDQIEITGTVNTTVIGTYTRTYTVVNSLGNTAVRNRWVYVIVDSIQPIDTIFYNDTATGIVMILMVSNGTYENIVISNAGFLDPPDSQDIVKAYDFNVSMESQATLYSGGILLPYTDKEVSEFIESTLTFRYYNETTGSWEIVPSMLDMNSNTIFANVSHFSIYGIIGVKNPTSIVVDENIQYQTKILQVNKHRIIFSLDRDCFTGISLYSSSGKLIKTLFKGYAKRGENIVAFQKGLNIGRGQYFIVLKSGANKKVIPFLTIE